MYVFHVIWEFTQSADCVVQTEDSQNACQSAYWHSRLCTCTCVYVHMYVYVCVCMCVCMCVFMHVCVCACVRDSVVIIYYK